MKMKQTTYCKRFDNSGLKLFLIYTWERLVGAPLKAEHLDIAGNIVGPVKIRVLTNYSCYWGPLWKQST